MSTTVGYPRLIRRIQALFIDGVIVPVAAISVLIFISSFDIPNIYSAISAALIIFILEPLLVSTTGGTLGHHIIGVQVKNINTGKNINIFFATIRFVSKIFLGIFSLISIFTTKKYQAFHDLLSRSVVTFKSPRSTPGYELLNEREVESSEYNYPSKALRIIMILIYNVILFVVIGVLTRFSLTDSCLAYNKCSDIENILLFTMQIIWVISIFSIVVYCWKCLLPGCRRKLI